MSHFPDDSSHVVSGGAFLHHLVEVMFDYFSHLSSQFSLCWTVFFDKLFQLPLEQSQVVYWAGFMSHSFQNVLLRPWSKDWARAVNPGCFQHREGAPNMCMFIASSFPFSLSDWRGVTCSIALVSVNGAEAEGLFYTGT